MKKLCSSLVLLALSASLCFAGIGSIIYTDKQARKAVVEVGHSPVLTAYGANSNSIYKVMWCDGAVAYAGHQITSGANEGKMYKSTDYGATWANIGDIGAATPNWMIVSQNTANLLIVIADNNHIYRSTDDGANWTDVKTMNYDCLSSGLTETGNGTLLVGEYSSSYPVVYRVYRSVDDGINWTNAKLSETAKSSSGNPGHWHFVQWDRHRNRVVIFVDYNVPEIYYSDDNGASWSSALVVTGIGTNCVQPMFGLHYVAWVMDSNAYRGQVYRIPYADFYAGNWTASELVGNVDNKMGYYSTEIDDGVFLFSVASENSDAVPKPGSYSNEIYCLYDNEGSIFPALRLYPPTIGQGTLTSQKARFAGKPYDDAANGLGWILAQQPGEDYLFMSFAVALGYGGRMPEIRAEHFGPLILQHGSSIKMKADGSQATVLRFQPTTHYVEFVDTDAVSATMPMMRFYPTGTIGFSGNGGVSLTFKMISANRVSTFYGDVVFDSAAYNATRLRMGSNYLWVDTSGVLRIKGSAPSSDNDGTIVGLQE